MGGTSYLIQILIKDLRNETSRKIACRTGKKAINIIQGSECPTWVEEWGVDAWRKILDRENFSILRAPKEIFCDNDRQSQLMI
jgi:hypothetical protein